MRPELSEESGVIGRVLLCPYCGEEYTHHDRVEIFDCGEDAESGLHVVVAGERMTADRQLTGNPSRRRHGLRIHFWCEICGGRRFALTIVQHKGATFLNVEPSLEREGHDDSAVRVCELFSRTEWWGAARDPRLYE
jgi:hypothetical protein